jgi:hypothetical protein
MVETASPTDGFSISQTKVVKLLTFAIGFNLSVRHKKTTPRTFYHEKVLGWGPPPLLQERGPGGEVFYGVRLPCLHQLNGLHIIIGNHFHKIESG